MRPEESNKSETNFSWEPYLDPKNNEFFREGDYLPPAPLMEIARDPSDKNIEKWFSYIEKKNYLSERLSKRLSEYVQKRQGGVVSDGRPELQRKEVDQRRFKFRLYFDFGCPHCRKMLQVMRELQGRGFMVEAKEIGGEGSDGGKKLAGTYAGLATEEEIRKFGIRSVPLLLAFDEGKKLVYRIQGYRNENEILENLRTK